MFNGLDEVWSNFIISFAIICVPICLVLIIGAVILKIVYKKRKQLDNNDKKIININHFIFSFCTLLILTLFFARVASTQSYPFFVLIITTLLFLCSVIFRFIKKYKISYILLIFAILVASISLVYFNNKESERKDLTNSKTDTEIELFNIKFKKYEGTKSGAIVKSLCDEIVYTNSSYGENGDFISVDGVVHWSSPNEEFNFDNIISSNNYSVSLNYNKYNLLDSIIIEEVN